MIKVSPEPGKYDFLTVEIGRNIRWWLLRLPAEFQVDDHQRRKFNQKLKKSEKLNYEYNPRTRKMMNYR